MRFYISTVDLNAGISVIAKALPSRTAMPILEGIYAEAQGNNLLLRCNDLSLQIETLLPATVEKEGSLVFPGRLFLDLARRQPDEQTMIETDKTTVTMKSGRARATMQAFDAAEYHSMPFSRQEFFVNIKKKYFCLLSNRCCADSAIYIC
jgi:DNA polymerase-3 subunit beta